MAQLIIYLSIYLFFVNPSIHYLFILLRLDPDEEAALSSATLDDIMALADILNTNPQVYKYY